MICVICEKEKASNGYSSEMFPSESITCGYCRMYKYPSHMGRKQYVRFWDAHNIKWRRENK
jgi:hypothetical protein